MSAMPATLRIGCKINLYLEIAGRRPDGYHELRTLFYPVAEPHDLLELEPAGDGLALACSDPSLETPDNLVARAYAAFAQASGFRPGVRARLTKGIPSGAGLGGGSADAAALLGWLNAHAGGLALSREALARLAAGLGADVPFFLDNTPAWATGIGERLEPAACDLGGLHLVLAVPAQRVPTAWAYRAWDAAGQNGAPGILTSAASEAMRPFCVSGTLIANSFEAVVFPAYPSVRALKERFLSLGASVSAMSGSGSAVFGIFRDARLASLAAGALQAPGTQVHAATL